MIRIKRANDQYRYVWNSIFLLTFIMHLNGFRQARNSKHTSENVLLRETETALCLGHGLLNERQ